MIILFFILILLVIHLTCNYNKKFIAGELESLDDDYKILNKDLIDLEQEKIIDDLLKDYNDILITVPPQYDITIDSIIENLPDDMIGIAGNKRPTIEYVATLTKLINQERIYHTYRDKGKKWGILNIGKVEYYKDDIKQVLTEDKVLEARENTLKKIREDIRTAKVKKAEKLLNKIIKIKDENKIQMEGTKEFIVKILKDLVKMIENDNKNVVELKIEDYNFKSKLIGLMSEIEKIEIVQYRTVPIVEKLENRERILNDVIKTATDKVDDLIKLAGK